MAAARELIIAGRNLNPAEQDKLVRVDAKLTAAFIFAGYSDVRVCEASGEGEQRELRFLRGISGSKLVTVTALEFLTINGDQLSELIATRLREL